mgnify:CR=1 FL=1
MRDAVPRSRCLTFLLMMPVALCILATAARCVSYFRGSRRFFGEANILTSYQSVDDANEGKGWPSGGKARLAI